MQTTAVRGVTKVDHRNQSTDRSVTMQYTVSVNTKV